MSFFSLLDKMASVDSDFRFMAINDLINELAKETTIDDAMQRKLLQNVLKLLQDTNGEVQNVTVKSLVPLVKKLSESQSVEMVDKLADMLQAKEENVRDIASVALKTLVQDLPSSKQSILAKLVPKLIKQLSGPAQDVQMETIDIVADTVTRFSNTVTDESYQQAVSTLLPLLSHPRNAVRKRAIVALGASASTGPDNLISQLQDHLLKQTKQKLDSQDWDKLKSLIAAWTTIVRNASQRLQVEPMIPILLKATEITTEDEELRENALNCLEQLALRCPDQVPMEKLLQVGVSHVKYDPNYQGDEDMSDEEMSDDDDYSDDDDVSWKVRRASARLLSALLSSQRPDQETIKQVLPVLISRFGERTESVRTDVFNTTKTLIHQCVLEEEGKHLLQPYLPSLIKALSKPLVSSSTPTRIAGFQLLQELAGVPMKDFGQLIPGLDASLKGNQAPTHLKIEALQFLRSVFSKQDLSQHVAKLTPPVVACCKDKFYRIASEALLTAQEMAKCKDDSSLKLIHEACLARLKGQDADLEVKERSISLMGTLMQNGVKDASVLPLLVERLKNELTRLVTVKTLGEVVDKVDLSSVLSLVFSETCSFLRKSSRQLRIASLQTLDGLIETYGEKLSPEEYQTLWTELKPLISEADFQILPMALQTLANSLTKAPKKLSQDMAVEVYPSLISLVQQNPHVVSMGHGLESLQRVWTRIAEVGDEQVYDSSIKSLLKPFQKGDASKQSQQAVATSLATLILHGNGKAVVKELQDSLSGDKDDLKQLTLLTLGQVGRSRGDLKLSEKIRPLFESKSEELRHAAAISLGNLTVGNSQEYLPIIISMIQKGGKQRYHALIALREAITRYQGTFPDVDNLWPLLFSSSEEAQEEATRNVISECLGKLSLSNPKKYLPDLRGRISSKEAKTRSTVVSAIRYTFSDHARHAEYDDLLRPMISGFLELMKDQEIDVRKSALGTLYSAAHNKPGLIRDSLDELMPLLYEETNVRQELIKMVEMGPFKHRVDDGLDLRKLAYECMYTLLDTCLSRLDLNKFMQRVIQGLNDPSIEIKIMAHLMLTKLVYLVPNVVYTKLEDAVVPLKEGVESKVKANAVKQEVEKNTELVRSCLRCVLVAGRLADTSTPQFLNLLNEIKDEKNPLSAEVLALQQEIDQRDAQGGIVEFKGMRGHGTGVVPMEM